MRDGVILFVLIFALCAGGIADVQGMGCEAEFADIGGSCGGTAGNAECCARGAGEEAVVEKPAARRSPVTAPAYSPEAEGPIGWDI